MQDSTLLCTFWKRSRKLSLEKEAANAALKPFAMQAKVTGCSSVTKMPLCKAGT